MYITENVCKCYDNQVVIILQFTCYNGPLDILACDIRPYQLQTHIPNIGYHLNPFKDMNEHVE